MAPTAWQLKESFAQCRSHGFRATVDLAQPDRGLGKVGLEKAHLEKTGPADFPWPDARWLAVVPAVMEAGDFDSPIEQHTRSNDLIVAYDQTASRPFRIDALWRVVRPSRKDTFAVELIVSVRTPRWESHPELTVQSVLPCSETLRLLEGDSGQFARVGLPEESSTTLAPNDGCGCLLFRLSRPWSYVEMIAPADFHGIEVAVAPNNNIRVAHRLFDERLEKGVIRRARLRGILLPRENDTEVAAACYREFVCSRMPLNG